MRAPLAALAALAGLTVFAFPLACSIAQPTAGPDPATAVTLETAQAGIDAPRHAKFRFGASHHMSCSMSWETSSEWGDYDLTLTPPQDAKLSFERANQTTFGANGKLGPGTTYDKGSAKTDYEGTVARVGDELRLELHPKGQVCASKDSPCSSLSLKCKEAKVTVTSYDDAGKHEGPVGALRCTPGFGLPEELDGKSGVGGALFFGDDETLELEYSEYGFSTTIGPELRVSSY